MKKDEMKEELRQFVCDYVETYGREHDCAWIWRKPLTGFADANCQYIRNIEEAVETEHRQPSDYLTDPTIVISCFAPFSREVSGSNVRVEDNYASKEWADAYVATNEMLAALAQAAADKVCEMGYHGVVPTKINMKEDVLKSPWSHRHMAYAAGLGTFGINNLLITDAGCCGRYCSVITDLPVTPDPIREEENCLYKKNGSCGTCADRCFSGALTREGYDRFKCFETCMRSEALYGHEVCGKCASDVPCSFMAPGAVKRGDK